MNFLNIYIFLKAIKFKLLKFKKKYNNLYQYYRFNKSNGSIGEDVNFGMNLKISGYNNITIGDNVQIGSGCFIRGEGKLVIEDNVIISRNVIIYTNSHNYEGKYLPFDDISVCSPVYIKKNSWIGMDVTISPGTVINEGAIIGLGTRVYGNVPALSIVGTSKLNIIKKRNKNHYNKLEEKKSYCKENGKQYIKNDKK